MERLRSVNFDLRFCIHYKKTPVVIEYRDQLVDTVNLSVKSLNQHEKIVFKGFTPKDQTQKVSYRLEYDGRKLNIDSITSFTMLNNPYVKNTTIENCNDIYFNGILHIDFSKYWFRHNVLSGANIDDEFVNWHDISIAGEEIFCVGDSYTFGQGVEKSESWPSLLDNLACNFGSQGLSHDGCLKNVEYILKHSANVKQIICLMPGPTRKLFNFKFLGANVSIPISHQNEHVLPSEYKVDLEKTKEFIITGNIKEDWIKTCMDIIDRCDQKKVQCWLSSWNTEMYEHIPEKNRLPKFPNMNTFTERADDGLHPHKKHYALFVEKIKPYIDKNYV